MIETGNLKTVGWYVHGFRRYRPENRINRGLLGAAPWVNLALLVAFYLYLLAPNVLQPGITIQLPESPFSDGRHYGHNIVVLSLPVAGSTGREEIFFFDDQRYLGRETAQMDALRAVLARAWADKANLPLVIEADRDVRHDTLVTLFSMASDAGFKEVTLGTRPGNPP
jgi:biopolymer transport protein ExbD